MIGEATERHLAGRWSFFMSELINVLAKSSIRTVRKDAPIDGAWVEFYTDITAGDRTIIQGASDDVGYVVATLMVRDWNFADEVGEKVDISIDGIKRLPLKLQQWVAETANEILIGGVNEKKS